jgi:hypothetical protein
MAATAAPVKSAEASAGSAVKRATSTHESPGAQAPPGPEDETALATG